MSIRSLGALTRAFLDGENEHPLALLTTAVAEAAGVPCRGSRLRLRRGMLCRVFIPFLYELRKRKVPVGAQEAIHL
ncbi:MAG: hypothetical protein ACK5U8_10860, partial [Deltaproteobacteria bacterium]